MGGYIRNMEQQNLKIPKALATIIIKFHQRNWRIIDVKKKHKHWNISSDGLTATLTQTLKYVSIRFGEFFNRKYAMEYRFKFKMGEVGRCAVGFITRKFVNFNRSTWNNGRNDMYSNGYNPTSHAFNEKDQSAKYLSTWCQDNEKIIVKINT